MPNLPAMYKLSRSKPFNWPDLRRLAMVLIVMVIGMELMPSTFAWGNEALLLRTGAVLQGEIDNNGPSYGNAHTGWTRVVGENREVRIRTSDILARADSLLGLYRWQRANFISSNSTAVDHLRLADWCLRYQLWPEASRELLDAKQLSPKSRRLALLERRLQQLSSAEPVPGKSQSPIAKADHSKPATDYLVQTATYEEATKEPSPGSNFHVDEAALTHFSRKIQPLLVNNCTESGCHRQGTTDQFVLDVSLLHGYGDARSTQNNLREVLAAIDTSDPRNSPLLTAAHGPHEGISPFVGPRRQEWLERLEAWVTQVSGTTPGTVQDRKLVVADLPTENQSIQTASYESENSERTTSDELSLEQDNLQPAEAPVIGGQLKQAAPPRDEFDPELFNRKYRRPEDDLPPSAG